MFGWLTKKNIEQTGWSAGAYFIANRIVVYSMSRTYNNIGWYNQPVFGLEAEVKTNKLGESLRQVLNASTWYSRKDDSCEKHHPILREAGAKSWGDLENRGRFVTIDTDKLKVTITPFRPPTKAEGGKGFVGVPEKTIELEWKCRDFELADALLNGFTRCESKEKR